MSHIVVLGGGVIGLSTAIALLDRPGAKDTVTLIAADLPHLPTGLASSLNVPASAPRTPAPAHYASAWAGAHHVSDARNERDRRWDQVTLDVMSAMHDAQPKQGEQSWKEGLVWAEQKEYWVASAEGGSDPTKICDFYPDYKKLPSSALPPHIAHGASFTTLNIVVPTYLPSLLQHFLALGGRTLQAHVASLDAAITLASTSIAGPKPSLLIVSPGLGARTLGGLQDANVHPVRGQTLLVKAPWLANKQSGRMEYEGLSVVRKEGFRDTYVIPRGDGTFIVGGTRLVNDDDPTPRAETTREILTRALTFMPRLANPSKWAGEPFTPSWTDVDVLAVNVGFRPARTGGPVVRVDKEREGVKVVLCYGFGGIGYQASWGAAFEARRCADEALGRSSLPQNFTLASLGSVERGSHL